MKIPELIQNIVLVGGDVLASFMGARLAERGKERVSSKEVLEEVIHAVFKERDDELLKDLLLLEEGSEAIRKLLAEANRRGFVKVGGKIYFESLIERLLRSIKPEDRPTAYRILNEACSRSWEEFFGLLDVVHNDTWLQVLRAAHELTNEKLVELEPRFEVLNKELQPTAEKLRARAEKKGWQAWADIW